MKPLWIYSVECFKNNEDIKWLNPELLPVQSSVKGMR